MIHQAHIALCYDAAYHDPATRVAMRSVVLPSLTRRADELESCRHECDSNPEWRQTWIDAGFVEEERQIRDAIKHAETVLSERKEATQ